ncbi:MAG: hypothetical protein KAK00_00135 [Nanoarchaeota archaeon]|nr:hypothetical protein [Nanoarchaeota archaeon]
MKHLKKDLKKILELITKNKLLFSLSVFIDFISIITFFSVFYPIMNRVYDLLINLSELTGILSSIPISIEAQSESYINLASSIQFNSLYSELLGWIAILALSVFLVWFIFQGVNAFLAARIIDKKTNFWKYIGKFSLFSLFFYILIILSFSLTVFLSVLNSKIIIPLFTQKVISFILITLLMLISYFWFISLVLIRKKKIVPAFLTTFNLRIKRLTKVFFVYFILMLILDFSLLLIYLSYFIHVILFFVLALFLLLPLVNILRIMFFYFMEKVS